MQMAQSLAGIGGQSSSALSSPSYQGAGDMVSSTLDARWHDSRLRSGSEGVVLLQRRDRKRQIREHDPSGNEGGGSPAFSGRAASGKVNRVAPFHIEGMTVGERLLIARRRSNESQETVARRFDMTRNTYGRLERDDEDLHSGISLPELGELTQEEICILLRRRAGLTQEECADKIGVTRFWFNQMEMGKVSSSDLVKFWESRV